MGKYLLQGFGRIFKSTSFILFMGVASSCTDKPSTTTVDSIFRTMERAGQFSGVVLIASKDSILLHDGYGMRNLTTRAENDTNTIFQIGSLTKQFTAEIILQLYHQGRLDLDDKVSKYIPDIPHGDSITIFNLLGHTSGLYDYTKRIGTGAIDPTQPIGKEELINLFINEPLSFIPGTTYAYNNSNYVLAGYIIEAVTGQKYETYMLSNIFSRCDMHHSGFDFRGLTDTNTATAFETVDGAQLITPIFDSSFSLAAGAMYSTASDMYKWYRALRDYQFAPPKTQELAYTPGKGDYGLGWQINDIRGKRYIYHEGKIGGFRSFELFCREDDLYIILLENYLSSEISNSNIVGRLLDVL